MAIQSWFCFFLGDFFEIMSIGPTNLGPFFKTNWAFGKSGEFSSLSQISFGEIGPSKHFPKNPSVNVGVKTLGTGS